MEECFQLGALAARVKAFIAGGEDDEAAFNALALELFALQFEQVGIYRDFCRGRGAEPGNVARWQEIPALPIEAFKDFEVTGLAAEERTAVFHSSGTTAEKRSRHFHGAASLALYADSLLPWFEKRFLPDGLKLSMVSLTPAKGAAPNSSLVHMFDIVANALPWPSARFVGCIEVGGAWIIDTAQADSLLRRTTEPVAVLGTAYSFVHLLDGMKATRLKLPTGSRVLETGGYKGRSREMPKRELHRLISKWLGIDPAFIVSEYGMSELSSQAYDRVAGKPAAGFQFPPWARARVISPE